MATERQYEFFHSLYQEEEARYDQLQARAQLYIGVISFFLGVVAFKLSDLKQVTTSLHASVYLLVLCGAAFLGSLLFCLMGVMIRTYEGIADPEELVKKFGARAPTDSEFFDKRILDLAVATNRNSAQNERVANFLLCSSISLFVAVALLIVGFVQVLIT